MLTSSSAFNLYWYARRGFFPENWAGNLLVSAALYVAAGILWNLEVGDGGRLQLAFTGAEWPPRASAAPFRRLAAPVLLLMAAFGGALFIPYLLHRS
jgi:hypothetical protein